MFVTVNIYSFLKYFLGPNFWAKWYFYMKLLRREFFNHMSIK